MDRRLVVSLALTVVVLAVSFAWLLGGGGTAGPTDLGETTPREVTPQQTSTADPDGAIEEFSERAVARHGRTLEGRDYALVYREDPPDGPAVVRTARSSVQAERMHVTVRRGNASLAEYLADGRLYRRQVANGTVEYEQVPNATASTGFQRLHATGVGEANLRTFVLVGNYTAAGNVTRDGRELRRYNATGLSREAEPTGTVLGVGGNAYVDRRGIVRSVNISVRIRQNGTVQTSNASYRVTAVGDVSVPRPDWVERAREADAEEPTQTTSSSG